MVITLLDISAGLRPTHLEEIQAFIASYTKEEASKLEEFILICESLDVSVPKPRHGQRLGQYIYNMSIGSHLPNKSVPLGCLFYTTDALLVKRILTALAFFGNTHLLKMRTDV